MEPQDPEFESLIQEHVPFVRYIARRIHSRLPSFIEIEELIARGNLGLCQAALHWERSSGVPFRLFAKHRIRGEILEVARRRLLRHSRTSQLPDDAERIFGSHEDIEQTIDQPKIDGALQDAFKLLSTEDQALFDLHFRCGSTWKECAQVFGVSEGTIFNRRNEALGKIRKSEAGTRLERYVVKNAGQASLMGIEQARRAAVIDELGEVQSRIQVFESRPGFKEYDKDLKRDRQLCDEIKTWIPSEFPGDKPTSFKGTRFTVEVSEKKNQRFVIKGGYHKIVGWLKDLFFDHCEVPLKALEVLLTPEQQQEVIKKDHVGYRSFKAVPIQKESVRKAA